MSERNVGNQQRNDLYARFHYSERRGSLIILSVTVVIIIILVITGIVASCILTKEESQIVLLWLIGLLLVVGVISFLFLEWQRREAQRNRDLGAADYVRHLYEQQRIEHEAARTLRDSKTATWAFTEPWRYSQRSTLKI